MTGKQLLKHKVNPMAVPGIYTEAMMGKDVRRLRKDAYRLANKLNFTIDELSQQTRLSDVKEPRQIIWHVLYKKYVGKIKNLEEEIGQIFGFDRTTVIHGVKTIRNLKQTEPAVNSGVEKLKKLISKESYLIHADNSIPIKQLYVGKREPKILVG